MTDTRIYLSRIDAAIEVLENAGMGRGYMALKKSLNDSIRMEKTTSAGTEDGSTDEIAEEQTEDLSTMKIFEKLFPPRSRDEKTRKKDGKDTLSTELVQGYVKLALVSINRGSTDSRELQFFILSVLIPGILARNVGKEFITILLKTLSTESVFGNLYGLKSYKGMIIVLKIYSIVCCSKPREKITIDSKLIQTGILERLVKYVKSSIVEGTTDEQTYTNIQARWRRRLGLVKLDENFELAQAAVIQEYMNNPQKLNGNSSGLKFVAMLLGGPRQLLKSTVQFPDNNTTLDIITDNTTKILESYTKFFIDNSSKDSCQKSHLMQAVSCYIGSRTMNWTMNWYYPCTSKETEPSNKLFAGLLQKDAIKNLIPAFIKGLKKSSETTVPAVGEFAKRNPEILKLAASNDISVFKNLLTTLLGTFSKSPDTKAACLKFFEGMGSSIANEVVADFLGAESYNIKSKGSENNEYLHSILEFLYSTLLAFKSSAPIAEKTANLSCAVVFLKSMLNSVSRKLSDLVSNNTMDSRAASEFLESLQTVFLQKAEATTVLKAATSNLFKESQAANSDENRQLAIISIGLLLQMFYLKIGGDQNTTFSPAKTTKEIWENLKKVMVSTEKKDHFRGLVMTGLCFSSSSSFPLRRGARFQQALRQGAGMSSSISDLTVLLGGNLQQLDPLCNLMAKLGESGFELAQKTMNKTYYSSKTAHLVSIDYSSESAWFKANILDNTQMLTQANVKPLLRTGVVVGLKLAIENLPQGEKVVLKKEIGGILGDESSFLNNQELVFMKHSSVDVYQQWELINLILEKSLVQDKSFNITFDILSNENFPVALNSKKENLKLFVVDESTSSSTQTCKEGGGNQETPSSGGDQDFTILSYSIIPHTELLSLKTHAFFRGLIYTTIAGESVWRQSLMMEKYRVTLKKITDSVIMEQGTNAATTRSSTTSTTRKSASVEIFLKQLYVIIVQFLSVSLEQNREQNNLSKTADVRVLQTGVLNAGKNANENYGFLDSEHCNWKDYLIRSQVMPEAIGESVKDHIIDSLKLTEVTVKFTVNFSLGLRNLLFTTMETLLPLLEEFPDLYALFFVLVHHPVFNSAGKTGKQFLKRMLERRRILMRRNYINEANNMINEEDSEEDRRISSVPLSVWPYVISIIRQSMKEPDVVTNPFRVAGVRSLQHYKFTQSPGVKTILHLQKKSASQLISYLVEEVFPDLSGKILKDTKNDNVNIFFQDETIAYEAEFAAERDEDLFGQGGIEAMNAPMKDNAMELSMEFVPPPRTESSSATVQNNSIQNASATSAAKAKPKPKSVSKKAGKAPPPLAAALGVVATSAKSKAAPKAKTGGQSGGQTAGGAPIAAAGVGGSTSTSKKVPLSKEEQLEENRRIQALQRQKMRILIAQTEAAMDILYSISQVPNAREILEPQIPKLIPHFLIFLGSPLTSLTTMARLRVVIRCVVPKSVISSRCVLPEILQVVGRNNLKTIGYKECFSSFTELMKDSSKDDTNDDDEKENAIIEDGIENSDNDIGGKNPLLLLLNSVSHEVALTAGGFSLLIPVLVEILRQASPESESLCSLALQILTKQLTLVNADELSLLTSQGRMELLEGLFTCIYKLPRMNAIALDTVSVVCDCLIKTPNEVQRVMTMYLQLSEKSRRSILHPSLRRLKSNPAFDSQEWVRIMVPTILMVDIVESGLADSEKPSRTLAEHYSTDPTETFALNTFASVIDSDSVFEDLLKIVKGQLPSIIFEREDTQKLGVKALAKWFLIVKNESRKDITPYFDRLKKEYTEIKKLQLIFMKDLNVKKREYDQENEASAKALFATNIATRMKKIETLGNLMHINKDKYWSCKIGLAQSLEKIFAESSLISNSNDRCGFLEFLLKNALDDSLLISKEKTIDGEEKKDDSGGTTSTSAPLAKKPAAPKTAAAKKASKSKKGDEDDAIIKIVVKTPAQIALQNLKEAEEGIETMIENLRDALINAGLKLIETAAEDGAQELLEVCEKFKVTSEHAEGSQLGSACYFGGIAKYLNQRDEKVSGILPRLFNQLLDPNASSSVQFSVIKVLPPLVKLQASLEKQLVAEAMAETEENKEVEAKKKVQEKLGGAKHTLMEAKLIELVETALNDKSETVRRGAAFGLGASIKGLSIAALKTHNIMSRIEETVNSAKFAASKQGAIMCLEGLTRALGRLFEPYVIATLPILLKAFADSAPLVRAASTSASRAIMGQLSAHGVKLVLPHLLNGIDDKLWRTKLASIELLASVVDGAPKQLSVSLPKVVPVLAESVNDTHSKVKDAAKDALERVGGVISNPEIRSLSPQLLPCLSSVNESSTKRALDALLQTSFVHNVDAPSLALVCPIVLRALKERSAEMKRKASQIVGSMVLLIRESKDISPHLPVLMPSLKQTLVDPIPDVRATTAKAFGTIAQALPEELLGDLLPWLFETLKSKESAVERSGAAHGLAEVLMALGSDRIDTFLPDILDTAGEPDTPPHVKEGYYGLIIFLPQTMGASKFEPWFSRVLNALLKALREEYQSVRDVAFRAAQGICKLFGSTHTALVLPPLEEGLFESDYRIRHSSVLLLLTTIECVLKANRMNVNSIDLMSCEVMPVERRAFVLSSIYIVRSDESGAVRHSATSVWKQLVQNTPRTVRELLPILMKRLIHLLASPNKEKQICASRCIGELVSKLGERVLKEVMPVFFSALTSETSSTLVREGVCAGLTELIDNCPRQLLIDYTGELVPAIRTAIVDNASSVREAASNVVALLYKTVGPNATTPVIVSMLEGLAHEDTRCLDGLEQLLSRQSQMVLPIILDTLPAQGPPWKSAAQVHGLATLSSLEDTNVFYRYISDVLEPMVRTIAVQPEMREDAIDAGRKLMRKVSTSGINIVLGELSQYLKKKDPRERESGAVFLRLLFEETTSIPIGHIADAILGAILPIALTDTDSATLKEAFMAFQSLMKRCDKEQQTRLLSEIKDIILQQINNRKYSLDPVIRKAAEAGTDTLPGLTLQGGLEPFYTVYQQSLMFGSSMVRLEAAEALGELVRFTTEAALKPYVVKITGPLIRIVGDRFAANIKIAILNTLQSLLEKGGPSLKPFLPQLQTTYQKLLFDAQNEDVRIRAAESLGLLVTLNPRVEALITDLASNVGEISAKVNCGDMTTEQKNEIRLSIAFALAEVLKGIAVDKLKPEQAEKIRENLKTLPQDDTNVKRCSEILKKKWP